MANYGDRAATVVLMGAISGLVGLGVLTVSTVAPLSGRYPFLSIIGISLAALGGVLILVGVIVSWIDF